MRSLMKRPGSKCNKASDILRIRPNLRKLLTCKIEKDKKLPYASKAEKILLTKWNNQQIKSYGNIIQARMQYPSETGNKDWKHWICVSGIRVPKATLVKGM